jgi:uncharacterized protein YjbK
MPRSIEREIKLAVERASHLERVKMVAGGDVRPTITQLNRFFDTKTLALRGAGYGLRLRTEANVDGEGEPRHLLAVKGPRVQSDDAVALTTRREVEREVDDQTARALIEDNLDPIQTLVDLVDEGDDRAFVEQLRARLDGELCYAGAFENERTRVDTVMIVDGLGLELVLELDKTLFPGDRVEYEIELEIPGDVDGAAAESALRSLMAIAGVEGHAARGKASRFFEYCAIDEAG